tara:strand:+ start:1263 stop:1460 length:198 start_codon:yes stop_codon:yes gene_type:complete
MLILAKEELLNIIIKRHNQMTHSEDLLKFQDNRIDALTIEVDKLNSRVEYLEAVLAVFKQSEFNH